MVPNRQVISHNNSYERQVLKCVLEHLPFKVSYTIIIVGEWKVLIQTNYPDTKGSYMTRRDL